MMLTAFLSLIALAAVAFAASRAVTYQRRLEKFELCMAEFIQSADALIKDDETPDVIIDLLEFMRHRAMDPWAALYFVRHLLTKDRHELGKSELPAEFREFIERRPELGAALSRASSAAMLAMGYRGYFVGGFIRLFVMFDAKSHSERMRDIAAHYKVVEQRPLPQAA